MKFLAPLRDADSESDMTSMELIVKRFEFLFPRKDEFYKGEWRGRSPVFLHINNKPVLLFSQKEKVRRPAAQKKTLEESFFPFE